MQSNANLCVCTTALRQVDPKSTKLFHFKWMDRQGVKCSKSPDLHHVENVTPDNKFFSYLLAPAGIEPVTCIVCPSCIGRGTGVTSGVG